MINIKRLRKKEEAFQAFVGLTVKEFDEKPPAAGGCSCRLNRHMQSNVQGCCNEQIGSECMALGGNRAWR